MPSRMQKIQVNGDLYGFKVGTLFLGIKTYKTQKSVKPISFVIGLPECGNDAVALRLFIRKEILRRRQEIQAKAEASASPEVTE